MSRRPPLGAAYRRLWMASAFSNLADGVFQVALPLLAVRLTTSPALVAGVALAQRLPWLVMALPAGALSDRLDRRRTMANVNVLRTVVIGSIAAALVLDLEHLALLYVAALVLGAGETLFDTSAQSIMPALVDRDRLSEANGRLYAVELTMNQFAGPPIGGVVAGLSMAAAFAGSAGAYLLAAAGLLLMTGSYRPEPAPRRSLRSEIAEGVRFVWGNRVLRTLGIMLGASNLASTMYLAIFVLFAVEPGPMGLTGAQFGLLLTAGALGGVLGSVVAARVERAVGRARSLLLAMVLFAASLAVPAVTAHAAPVAVSLVVSGAVSVLWNVITVSLRQRITPDRLLGRMNSVYRLLGWGTMPLGAALGGLVAETLGLRATFAIAAAINAALLVGALVVTDAAIDAAEAAGDPSPSDFAA